MEVLIESSWQKVLQSEFEKEYFSALADFVRSEYRANPGGVFPKGNEIFKAFDACPFDQVKVVILGQDPYPTRGHAHGLCFSVLPTVAPLPKSLQNIFKELELEGFPMSGRNGDLSVWANQGVLLLNAVLTVREGQPESHAKRGWEQFTDAVIRSLSEQKKNVVYLLWGSKAQQKAMVVDESKNLILRSVHPSPLSVYRGFFGCNHFNLTNEYLLRSGKTPVEW